MKKYFLLLIFFISAYTVKAQDVFTDPGMKVAFFSKTPMANIDAHSEVCSGALNRKTKQIFATVKVKSFEFKHELMKEHFNDDYIESDKYPDATFNGTIKDDSVDLTKDGTYNVTATGKLTVHGVSVDRTIPITITVSGKQITVHSEFMVHIADHKIKIPTLVVEQVAEDVKVTVDGALNLYTGN